MPKSKKSKISSCTTTGEEKGPKRRKRKSVNKKTKGATTSSSQRAIIGELLVLFKAVRVLDSTRLSEEHSKVFRGKGGLRVRGHGFSGIKDMVKTLDIFDCQDEEGRIISLNDDKLLDLVLSEEEYEPLSSEERKRVFVERNGFDCKGLCEYFEVSSLEDLLFSDSQSSCSPPPTDNHPPHPSTTPTSFSYPLLSSSQPLPSFRHPAPSLRPPLLPPRPVPFSCVPLPHRPPPPPIIGPRSRPFFHSPPPLLHPPPPPPPPRAGINYHAPYLLPQSQVPRPLEAAETRNKHLSLQAPPTSKRPAEGDDLSEDGDSSPPAPKKIVTDDDIPKKESFNTSTKGNQAKPVTETGKTGSKEEKTLPSSAPLFIPLEAPPHFPDPSIHPRDVHHPPSFTNQRDQHQDQGQLPPLPQFRRGETNDETKKKINSYLEIFTGVLSSRGKHVPLSIVEGEVRLLLDAARGRGCYLSFKNVDFWVNWDKLYKRTIEFIKVFCWHSPITTLYELQRILTESEGVKDFKELKMGPLLKHPEVIRLFKVPEDLESVPELTAYDVHSKMFRFLDKNKTRERTQMERFLEFLSENCGAESPLHLCIRISSYPLACQINIKFRRSQRIIRDRVESELEKSANDEIQFEFNNWKKKLSRMSSETAKELEHKDPVQLIEGLMGACQKYFPRHVQSRLTSFFQFLLDYRGMRDLFLLAVYEGVYGVQKKVREEAVPVSPGVAPLTPLPSSSTSHMMTTPSNYRSQSEIHNYLLHMLQSLHYPVDLSSLAETQNSLLVQFGAPHFESFGHGTFLEFLSKHQELVKALGGSTIGSEAGGSGSGWSKREEVLECVRQLKDLNNKDSVSCVLLKQFNVHSISQLGCGHIEKLISDAQNSTTTTISSSSVRYLSSLLANNDQNTSTTLSLSSNEALKYLASAPLLTDLASWSNWDIVCKPSLGSLSQFLSSHSEIHTLCVSDGVFLKISPDSSVDDFTGALNGADPLSSSGHVVSMAVRSGISNLSTQLLAQHVQAALSSMFTGTGGVSPHFPVQFVLECLMCMPLELSVSIGKKVFLDPLNALLSSSTVYHLLLEATANDQHRRSFLHSFALKLGIKVLIDDYRSLTQKKTSTSVLVTEPVMPVSKPVNPESDKMEVDIIDTITTEALSTFQLSLEGQEGMTVMSKGTQSPLPPRVTVEDEQEERETARTIINNIRSDEFGIGLEVDDRTSLIMSKGKGRLDRSLQRLSEELYSKDTHFVLELVQNADDNSYLDPTPSPASSFVPSLKFTLSKHCIIVLNNETGFSEKNIRAICDVGRSTKDRNASGYIGQKGIGFKSVFRVTETPEVHSRGYHIRFDSSMPIGYILPQWVEHSVSEEIIDKNELEKWRTRIVLPLKSDANSLSSGDMMSRFQDIQPSLLLFLNRLRCIVIEDMESKVVRNMRRYDKSNGIIEIKHNEGIDKWLVVRKTLNEANKYKQEVSATELALAFPLPDDLHSLNYDLSPQQVFAFLPLRSYGFRFIVQGDFDLPSSREDVNANSAWNQWLREEIPSLFMKSIDSFKSLPPLTAVEAIIHILKFIPLEGEVHDFFQPVTSEILRLFKGREVLPTEPSPSSPAHSPSNALSEVMSVVAKQQNDNNYVIQWKQPSQLILIKEQSIRECIPQSLLTSSLKLYYLNSALTDHLSSQICSQLSIGCVNIDHLISVAQYVISSFREQKEKNFAFLLLQSSRSSLLDDNDDSFDDEENDVIDIEGGGERDIAGLNPVKCLNQWIAMWLSCVHCLCEGGGGSDELNTLRKLRGFPIIPLSNGEIVSIDSGPVFFPPVSDKDIDISFRPIYNELSTVHTDLIETDEKLVSVKANNLLLRLGVRDLNIIDVIEQHVVAQFKHEKSIKGKSDKLLILYLSFIKNAVERKLYPLKKVIDELKEDIVLVTSEGRLKPSSAVIHFHSRYKPQCDLTQKFPDVKWVVVSPKYVQSGSEKNWKEFLASLGVEEGIAVEKINQKLTTTEIMSKWSISNLKRSPDGCYTVHDYHSKDFELILSSMPSLSHSRQMKQMRELLQLLNSSWMTLYSKCITAFYYDGSNTHELGVAGPSTFGKSLVSKEWLPAVNLDGTPYSTPLLQGFQLYSMTDELRSLLHNNVPYLEADAIHAGLLEHLHVQTKISCIELYQLLCIWSESPSFRSSIDHMRQVYIHLSDLTHNRVDFSSKPLIFVPDINQWRNDSTECVSGGFVTAQKACWSDKTGVLYNMLRDGKEYPSHLPQVLSYFYSTRDENIKRKIKNAFFTLQVQGMSLETMIELLEFNASLSFSPSEDHISSFYSIIDAIVDMVENTGTSATANQDYVEAKAKKLLVFPSKNNKKWVSLDGLFIDDNREISKHFLKDNQVHFLNTSSKTDQSSRVNSLFKIPLVSENTVTDLNPSAVRPYNDLKARFHYIMPLLQLYLHNKYKEIGSNHYEEVAQTLTQLTFLSTLELNCTYCLHKVHYATAQLKQCTLHVKPDSPPVVYVVVNDTGRIIDNVSLSTVILTLALPKGLMSDISSSVSSVVLELLLEDLTSKESQDSFINKYSLAPLLAESCKWHVDLPVTSMTTKKREAVSDAHPSVTAPVDNSKPVMGPESSTSTDGSSDLKSWPPKAPVRMEESRMKPAPQHSTTYSSGDDRVVTKKDVITSDDVHRMRGEREGDEMHKRIKPEDKHNGMKGDYERKSMPRDHEAHTATQTGSDSVSRLVSQSGSHPAHASNIGSSGPKSPSETENLAVNPAKSKGLQTGGSLPKKQRVDSENETEQPRPQQRQETFALSSQSRSKFQLFSISSEMMTLEIDANALQKQSSLDMSTIAGVVDDTHATGRWGEEYVYNYLSLNRHLPNIGPVYCIEWMNEKEESLQPYDVKFKRETDDEEFFLEVKSTVFDFDREDGQNFFAISWNEICFAQQKGQHFLLVVLSNAGNLDKVHVRLLRDLYNVLQSNPSIKLYIKL